MRVVQYGEINEQIRRAFLESLNSRCNTYPEGAVIVNRKNECIGFGYRRLLVNDLCRSECIKTRDDSHTRLCMKIHSIDMAIAIAHAKGNAKKLLGSTLYCIERKKASPEEVKKHYPAESISLIHRVPFACCVEQLVFHKVNVALRNHDNTAIVIYRPNELLNLKGCGTRHEEHQLAETIYKL